MSSTPNVAHLFDRNPLHVAHLQGPVDRLADTNLRAIYERAGKILLIQRWKDLKTGEPHAFLLYETEQAATACCSRISAVRITSDRQCTRPITASLLGCATVAANSILYMWLRSQSMTPSYALKNPPPPPPCASFPLGCLTPLTENCGAVVQKLIEHKCSQSWWRFVAQMYVHNKMWAAAQFILGRGEISPCVNDQDARAGKGKEPLNDKESGKTGKTAEREQDRHNETSQGIIDISDDSVVEIISESEDEQCTDFARAQQRRKSSAANQPKAPTAGAGKRNAWLPVKRANVQGARAKLGVVPAKQAPKPNAEKIAPSAPEAQLPRPSTMEASKGQPSTPAILPAFVPTPVDPTTTTEPSNPSPEATRPTPPTVPTPLSTPPEPVSSVCKETSSSGIRPSSPVSPTEAPPSSMSSATGVGLDPGSAGSKPPSTASLSASSAAAPNLGPTISDSTGVPDELKPTPTPAIATTAQGGYKGTVEQAEKQGAIVPTEPPSIPQSDYVQAPIQTLPTPSVSGTGELRQAGRVHERERAAAGSPASTGTPITTGQQPNTEGPSSDQLPVDRIVAKEERSSPAPATLSEPVRKVSGSAQTLSLASFGASITAPNDDLAGAIGRPKTPIRPPVSCEDLSFFGRSSSPGLLDLGRSLSGSSLVPSLSVSSSLSPGSSSGFSPLKRKMDLDSRGFEGRLKRRRHRASSNAKSDVVILLEPEVSALEAEQARAAELQAEEDRVREILEPPSPSSTTISSDLLSSKFDLTDYPEIIASRLLGLKSRSQKSSSSLSKRSSISSITRVLDDDASDTSRRLSLGGMDPRSWKATLDENEALKMKIKVLELTLPTAESVKNELHAERKEKTQLIEALEIERSLLIQSEALRRQLDVTREEQTTRIKQLEDRLADSAVTIEKAHEVAQAAAEQRRQAEEASHAADAERTKLGVLLDAERALVNSERATLARERETRAALESKLAATEARLSAEQRRSAEASEQADKERIKAKDFLDAEKAIVVAQEAKLERELEIRTEIEAKLEASEAKLTAERLRHFQELKELEATLQKEISRLKLSADSERALVQSERAKVVEEHEARSKVEKELVVLKEDLETSEKKLKASDQKASKLEEELSVSQKEAATLKEKLHDAELREREVRGQLHNWHNHVSTSRDTTEARVKAAEERANLADTQFRQQGTDLANLRQMLNTEKEVLMMERATLARERLLRKDQEKQTAAMEERMANATKQIADLHRQLQETHSLNEQIHTQRTMLHIARTRIQELEQAIQLIEHDLDAARSAEATAKTMLQLGWGSRLDSSRQGVPRTHSSPVSDIVIDRNQDEANVDLDRESINPFASAAKPQRPKSFKLKRTTLPARLLKLDMPSCDPVNIDLGSLPANPAAIIDVLYKSKCAGVFWDIIMDEYGAMGCFEAAEAVAASKLKCQLH